MKKLLINISCVIAVSAGFLGCKSKLDDYYIDPDKSGNPTIEKLFSGILDNNRARPNYTEMGSVQFPTMGAYCQTIAIQTKEDKFVQAAGPIQDLWNDYYTPSNTGSDLNYNTGNGVVAQYRTMERLFANLPPDEIGNFRIFMMAGQALLLDQTAQMIDMFGDIPFSEAGTLDLTNTIHNAKFDKQDVLYDSVLTGLKNVADWFTSTTPNAIAANSFTAQDFLMKGSIDKWRRYINSIRLRYLMRVSYVDAAWEKRAHDEIQEIFSNPILYPLVDGDGVGDNYNPGNTDILLHQFTNYSNTMWNAFSDNRAQIAPDYMLNTVMVPANDPRIPVMFDKNSVKVGDNLYAPNKEYKAMSIDNPKQGDSIGYYALYDSSTYLYNKRVPGVYISAPEVNFLKAEAFERWGLTGGTAQASYELAVRQSIAFVYYIYNLNTDKTELLTQPATSTVTTFLSQPSVAYTGDQQTKLAKIWTQKWLFYGPIQGRQAWAEWRRTGYPQVKITPASRVGYELPPTRFQYPASESAYNSRYNEVRDQDKRDVKIFWMKKE